MTGQSSEPAPRTGIFGPIRRLYDWVLSWADSPWGPLALFCVSFVESSFFPIPPDPLLLALCLGAIRKSWWFAGLCTLASVLGGLLGYAIGMFAFDTFGLPILETYGKVEDFEVIRQRFLDEGNLAVLIAAITPVPYKLVTITAGVAQMDLPAFVGASVIGRGFRFFLEAGLLFVLGERVAEFIEQHFEKLTVAFWVLLVGGFLAVRAFLH